MCRKSLFELLTLADRGCLENEDLLHLEQYVEGCAHCIAVRVVVRQRCQRVAAPPKLRLRILQTFHHRATH
jgi:hypothetical protein